MKVPTMVVIMKMLIFAKKQTDITVVINTKGILNSYLLKIQPFSTDIMQKIKLFNIAKNNEALLRIAIHLMFDSVKIMSHFYIKSNFYKQHLKRLHKNFNL